MPVDNAIWVTGASSIGLVGGTIVCTLLGAVLFARGMSQNSSADFQSREQVIVKRRRIKPVKKAEQSTSAEQGDTADS